jgi:hypothetical protein
MSASPGDIVKVHMVAVMVAPLPVQSGPEKVAVRVTMVLSGNAAVHTEVALAGSRSIPAGSLVTMSLPSPLAMFTVRVSSVVGTQVMVAHGRPMSADHGPDGRQPVQ